MLEILVSCLGTQLRLVEFIIDQHQRGHFCVPWAPPCPPGIFGCDQAPQTADELVHLMQPISMCETDERLE